MKLSENKNMENILPGSLFGGYTLLKTVAFLLGFILWTVVPSRRVCLIIIFVCILDTFYFMKIESRMSESKKFWKIWFFKKFKSLFVYFSAVEFSLESRNLSTETSPCVKIKICTICSCWLGRLCQELKSSKG